MNTSTTTGQTCRGCGKQLAEIRDREGDLIADVHAADDSLACPDPDLHFHVFAVQDWGGSSEHWRHWEEPWSYDDAITHGIMMIFADHGLQLPPQFNGMAYGISHKRFRELASTNISPGWNAIWIEKCAEPCCVDCWVPADLGEPWWTPEAAPIREGVPF